MRAGLADLLVTDHAAQHLGADLLLPHPLQGLVDRVDERHEELHGVLLLPQVDRLSQHLEVAPEALWDVVLQLRGGQVAEDGLHLLQDSQVVVAPVAVLLAVLVLKPVLAAEVLGSVGAGGLVLEDAGLDAL